MTATAPTTSPQPQPPTPPTHPGSNATTAQLDEYRLKVMVYQAEGYVFQGLCHLQVAQEMQNATAAQMLAAENMGKFANKPTRAQLVWHCAMTLGDDEDKKSTHRLVDAEDFVDDYLKKYPDAVQQPAASSTGGRHEHYAQRRRP